MNRGVLFGKSNTAQLANPQLGQHSRGTSHKETDNLTIEIGMSWEMHQCRDIRRYGEYMTPYRERPAYIRFSESYRKDN